MRRAPYREIQIHRQDGTVRARVRVDAEDYDSLTRHRWHISAGRYVARSERRQGKKRMVYMHRQILGVVDGGPCVDHINRDPLDNRRSNLRLVSHAENMQNHGAHQDSTSPHRGVCWVSGRRAWRAQVRHQGKNVYVGQYATEDEAAVAAAEFRRLHLPFSAEALGSSAATQTGSFGSNSVAAPRSRPANTGVSTTLPHSHHVETTKVHGGSTPRWLYVIRPVNTGRTVHTSTSFGSGAVATSAAVGSKGPSDA